MFFLHFDHHIVRRNDISVPVLRGLEDATTGSSSDNGRGGFNGDRGIQAATIMVLLTCLALFIVWLYFSFQSYYSLHISHGQDTARQDEANTASNKKDDLPSLEQAKQTLLRLFEKNQNQKVVENNDFKIDSQRSNQDPVDLEEGPGGVGQLILSRTCTSKELSAPNCCAICLEPYSSGELVAWSLNEACQHIYHTNCIINFFAHKINKGQSCLCPTCRQSFCSVDHHEKEEKANRSNPSTVHV